MEAKLYLPMKSIQLSKIINKEFFYNKEQNQFLNNIKQKYTTNNILNFVDIISKAKSNGIR